MKTVALIFLSLFLSKSCQSKKDTAETPAIAVDTITQMTVTTETPNSEVPVQKNETVMASDSEKQEKTVKVEYEALSRGFYKKVVLENDQVTVVSDREGKGETVKLSKEQVSEFSNLIKAVNLEELPNLKAPTEKRMYDGAAHANLIITANGKTYAGSGFDAGFPPKAIEKLVNKLVSFSEKK